MREALAFQGDIDGYGKRAQVCCREQAGEDFRAVAENQHDRIAAGDSVVLQAGGDAT